MVKFEDRFVTNAILLAMLAGGVFIFYVAAFYDNRGVSEEEDELDVTTHFEDKTSYVR